MGRGRAGRDEPRRTRAGRDRRGTGAPGLAGARDQRIAVRSPEKKTVCNGAREMRNRNVEPQNAQSGAAPRRRDAALAGGIGTQCARPLPVRAPLSSSRSLLPRSASGRVSRPSATGCRRGSLQGRIHGGLAKLAPDARNAVLGPAEAASGPAERGLRFAKRGLGSAVRNAPCAMKGAASAPQPRDGR